MTNTIDIKTSLYAIVFKQNNSNGKKYTRIIHII